MSFPKPLASLAGGGIGGLTASAVGKALKPEDPAYTSADAPPVIEDTQAKQQQMADMLKRRRGRAASILTSGQTAAPVTAAKQLLGQ